MLHLTHKFVIFGHARSGSSTLKCLIEACGASVLGEPFNVDYTSFGGKDYLSLVSRFGVTEAMDQIFIKNSGFKTLKHQLSKKQNEELLCYRGMKVVFLRRRNWLKTAISSKISMALRVWQRDQITGDYLSMVGELPPLNIQELKHHMICMKSLMNYYENFAVENIKNKCMFVYYEDVYEDKNLTLAKQIVEFCGHKTDDRTVQKYLSDDFRLNSAESYHRISNIHEIENELGNDETGWVFHA